MKVENKRSLFTKIGDYFRSSREEIEKTIFPDKVQIRGAFISVVVVVVFITLLLAIFDLLVSLLISAVL